LKAAVASAFIWLDCDDEFRLDGIDLDACIERAASSSGSPLGSASGQIAESGQVVIDPL
jgi:hypothetical protein